MTSEQHQRSGADQPRSPGVYHPRELTQWFPTWRPLKLRLSRCPANSERTAWNRLALGNDSRTQSRSRVRRGKLPKPFSTNWPSKGCILVSTDESVKDERANIEKILEEVPNLASVETSSFTVFGEFRTDSVESVGPWERFPDSVAIKSSSREAASCPSRSQRIGHRRMHPRLH
ncbi:hypothetical protein L596_021610 [Steinernema carpocapsae]|uniref:Uncharacterized protein n=1 Tax=Steinernema carpocapsae TaxID=34508 RepID=A0A4U5MJA8_STECR|nr:hypothetical protein L596_021610 [Steinernema carpocapsae]